MVLEPNPRVIDKTQRDVNGECVRNPCGKREVTGERKWDYVRQ